MANRSRNPRKTDLCWFVVMTVLLLPGVSSAESPDDILIIANLQVPDGTVSMADIKNFYQKRKTNWPSGSKVIPIHASSGTRLREEFLKRVMDMTPTSETTFWRDAKIRRGQDQPVAFGNPLKAVFKLRNSIGYVFRSQYREGVVKILATIPAK